MTNKKDSKVRDLKAKKDVKGGGPGKPHSNHPFLNSGSPGGAAQGTHGPSQTQGGHGPVHQS